jgi:hypothetical protein
MEKSRDGSPSTRRMRQIKSMKTQDTKFRNLMKVGDPFLTKIWIFHMWKVEFYFKGTFCTREVTEK